MSYYATLAERGYFPHEWLKSYGQDGGRLPGHPSPQGIPGIGVATGSLGHGLAIGAGTALARSIDGRPGRTFVVLSDGECNEGSVWESAMFAAGRKLDTLIGIVDYNKIQATGRSNQITALAPLVEKWESFGWNTHEIDGHSLVAIIDCCASAPVVSGKPTMVIAHTIKGKGVGFMEDDPEWHYRPPSTQDLQDALEEIGK